MSAPRDYVAEAAARSAAARDTILSSVPPEHRLTALQAAIDEGNIAEGSADAKAIAQSVSDSAATGALIKAETVNRDTAVLYNWLLRVRPLKPMPDFIAEPEQKFVYAGPEVPPLPEEPVLDPVPTVNWWYQEDRLRTLRNGTLIVLATICVGVVGVTWKNVLAPEAARRFGQALDWLDVQVNGKATLRQDKALGCSQKKYIYTVKSVACVSIWKFEHEKLVTGTVIDRDGDAIQLQWPTYDGSIYTVWAQANLFDRP